MARSRLKRIRRTLGGETTLEGAIDAMGKQREGQVLGTIREFTELVVVIVAKLVDLVDTFVADDYDRLEAAACELDRLESEADRIKESILDDLSTGGVYFLAGADLARLVGSMDAIANLAAGAADRIAMRKITLPAELNDQLVIMVHHDLEAVTTLRDAVFAMEKDLRASMDLGRVVERIEGRADDTFAGIYRFMFDMETDFKTFHQLYRIVERLESITDKCAQSAEVLRHIALEYLEPA